VVETRRLKNLREHRQALIPVLVIYVMWQCANRPSPSAQVAGDKRSHASVATEDEQEQARLSLATALQLSVWQDHLVPVLKLVEAARLKVVCKTLAGVINECPVELRGIESLSNLQAACFPAAPSVRMYFRHPGLEASDKSRVVDVLRGHGGPLKHVEASGLLSAVRAGALPNLTSFSLSLSQAARPAVAVGRPAEVIGGGEGVGGSE
jgi:hypothetical protein